MNFNAFFLFFQQRVSQLTTMASRRDGQEEMQEQITQNQEKARDLQQQINAIELNVRQSAARQPQSVDASAGIVNVLNTGLEPEKEKQSDQDKNSKPCSNGHAWCSDSSTGHYVTRTLTSAPPTPPSPVAHHTTTKPQGVLGQPGQPVSPARTTLIGSVVGVAKQPALQPPSDFVSAASARPNPSQSRGRGRHVNYNRGNIRHPRPTPRASVGRGNSRRGTPGPHQPTTRHRPKPCKLTTGFRWFCVASFQAQVLQQVFELVQEQVSAGVACAITLLVLFVCLLCK